MQRASATSEQRERKALVAHRSGRRWRRGLAPPMVVIAILSAGALAAGGTASAAPPKPGVLSLLAGNGTAGLPEPGRATSSPLDNPFGVAVDGLGNVYIADAMNNEVEKVTPSGVLSIFAGTGAAGAPTPGPAAKSKLHYPAKVAVDGFGNVYIADAGNNEVEKVTTAGVLSVIAGTGTAGAPTPGPATSSDLNLPYGVAVDGLGNVYIGDATNNRVEKVSTAGVLSIIAGNGKPGNLPTPGPAIHSALNGPAGVAVDGLGNVYIADTYNHLIDKVSDAGVLSIFAGTGNPGAPTPGPATHSDLQAPYGVSVDPSGDVYIADTFNQRVEKVTPSGTLSFVAGNGGTGNPTAGPALQSMLNQPAAVAINGLGNIYATNFAANDVVKVTSSEKSTVGIAVTASGDLTATSVGNVYNHGTAFHGSPSGDHVTLTAPIVAIAATAKGGYLVTTAAGNVYNYGTAFHGSPSADHVSLTSPITGIAATGDGGYVVVTAAGNVYTYGTAFHGSPSADHVRLTSPIAGITATGSGGYLLTTAAGIVYHYATASHGEPAPAQITSPVTGITVTGDGGYLLATANGGIYNYGTGFNGSPRRDHVTLGAPISGLAATANGSYFLTTSTGTVYTYKR